MAIEIHLFPIGNTSTQMVDVPASYVSLPEGNQTVGINIQWPHGSN